MVQHEDLITLDNYSNRMNKAAALVEAELCNPENTLTAYVRFSTGPTLWLYELSNEYQELRYVDDVVPSEPLEILDYSLIAWSAGGQSGHFRLPSRGWLRNNPIGYQPRLNEMYQFKDDNERYYRLPVRGGELVTMLRGDIFIPSEELSIKQQQVNFVRQCTDEGKNKNIIAALVRRKWDKVTLDASQVGLRVGIIHENEYMNESDRNYNKDEAKKTKDRLRKKVNRAIEEGERILSK